MILCVPSQGITRPTAPRCRLHTIQKEHYLLTAVFAPDCILPGLVLAFVPSPFRVQGFEGEAVVCISSSSYLPKWCDVSTKGTTPVGDHLCSKAALLRIDCALWTNDLDSLCLGFYPFKMGIVIETNSWGRCEDSIKITYLHQPYCVCIVGYLYITVAVDISDTGISCICFMLKK